MSPKCCPHPPSSREKKGSHCGLQSSHYLVVGGISGEEKQMFGCSWPLKGFDTGVFVLGYFKRQEKK